MQAFDTLNRDIVILTFKQKELVQITDLRNLNFPPYLEFFCGTAGTSHTGTPGLPLKMSLFKEQRRQTNNLLAGSLNILILHRLKHLNFP